MKLGLSWGARLNGKVVMRPLCRLFPVIHVVVLCAIFGLLVCCNGRDIVGRPRAVVKALREANREILDTYQLWVVSPGGGFDDLVRYREIFIMLEGIKQVELPQARALVLDCYDIYYKHVNSISNPEMFLSDFPFEKIQLFLIFREKDGGQVVQPYLAGVSMYDDKIKY